MSASASIVADRSLAPEGHRKIRWVEQHAPVMNAAFERYLNDGTLRGQNVAVCVPLEAKTAYLTLLLHRAGANVALAGTAPGYVQDDVAAAIAEEGVTVFAVAGASAEEFEDHLIGTIRTNPVLLVDDRAELTRILLTKETSRAGDLWGASEQTTSGVTKLLAMQRDGILRYPVIAGNDAMCKHLFDNRYGTGQSAFGAILALTNLYLGGKSVVIAGYGWCGKGLARRAAALQSRVVVCEVDPVRALEAVADGFAVMPLAEAAEVGDFFVTSTGTHAVYGRAHFERMKDGAVLANAGGLDTEIDVPPWKRWRWRSARSGARSRSTGWATGGDCTCSPKAASSTSPAPTDTRSRSWTSPSPCRRWRFTTSGSTGASCRRVCTHCPPRSTGRLRA